MSFNQSAFAIQLVHTSLTTQLFSIIFYEKAQTNIRNYLRQTVNTTFDFLVGCWLVDKETLRNIKINCTFPST